ncbi:MAG TPA: DinB family protein [Bryobacteraceae bacterium]|nr:DinB family protein [Bryobacteraceae bacterium]
MNYYGGRELAASFRTVRNNTIKIAEDIGEQHYGFRATPESRSVAETLIHISHLHEVPYEMHGVRKISTLAGFDFMSIIGPLVADEKAKHSKAEILKKLAAGRDQFGTWLEGLGDDVLGQAVSMPPGAQPAAKSRFEMLLGVKEHEMHHRGQLMVVERLVGVVPHLTRQREEMMAQMRQQAGRS